MIAKKKGFLLSYIKYGDNDAILHCFTNDEGFESFFIRGIYTAKNKKKSLLTPLSEIYLDVNLKRKSATLNLLNSVEKVQTENFEFNIKQTSILFFISDFLYQVLKNENSQNNIYREIEVFISVLKSNNLQSHLVFLFKILKLLGFSPLHGEGKYLDLETGVFTDLQTHQVFTEEISQIWKNFLENPESLELKIPKNKSREILNALLLYFQFHFDHFKTPVSLEIVKEIFQ